MIPVTQSDGRSIFMKNESLIRALTYLPIGIALSDNPDDYFDPEQLEDAEEQFDKTPHKYVGDTIQKISEILSKRPPKKREEGKEYVVEDELKFFFEDLHYKLLEKKRFYLRSLHFRLPDVYSPTYSLKKLNEKFRRDIEKVREREIFNL